MKLKSFLSLLLLLSCSLSSFAVSDKDMEQAKVTAAKLYLRWTNNASGYLDDVSASSMADLESKLKTQEIENLKAFKSVPIPADYHSWDKERFVQFWGTTFFTSPALTADGKRAKDRVKAKVKSMNVAAPTSSPAETAPTTAEANETASTGGNKTEDSEAISIPEPKEVIHQEEAALLDSMATLQAEEESVAMQPHPGKAKSNTWIYVIILIVLVILVVCLMVYAANMMKRQNNAVSDRSSNNPEPSSKEIKSLESSLERLRQENVRLKGENERIKRDNEQYKKEISELHAALKSAKSAAPKPRTAAEPPTVRQQQAAAPAPKATPKVINEIFLGRANPKGLFVRGDRRPNPEHTVYRLNTKDGIVGTFRFADTQEALALAKSNPLQFLAGGCICENFEDAPEAHKIVTDTPGTAILENGCWKVLRKSRIRFE